MMTKELQEAARKALGRAESAQRAAAGTYAVYLPWAYEFVDRVGAAVLALTAEVRPSRRSEKVTLFTPDEMKAGAELYAKTRASITTKRGKPGYTPPFVPADLQDVVERAGLDWYGLDPEVIANRLPAFPQAAGIRFLQRERSNPVPLRKGEKGPDIYYGGSNAAMALAWQEFAPEGFPPQPNRGSTYSKAEERGIVWYVDRLWPPEIQLRRFAKAVDQYLKAHLPGLQYNRTVGTYRGQEIDYAPSYFARGQDDPPKFNPAGQDPENVASVVNAHANKLAETYTYLVSLLQPGLLDDYTGHPELIDRQYETIKNTPYAFRIGRRLLDFYLGRYHKIKLDGRSREENAEDLVERDNLKISEALTLIARADKARAAEQEVYNRKQNQGLRLVYATLRGYAKPPRLQTLLDAHPALKPEMRQGSIRLYYRAPGDTDLTMLLYHDGNQTSLMEKLWQDAQRQAE